jgi:hypothetical protein
MSFPDGGSQGKEEDIICNRQREVNGHTVTNEILWHAMKSSKRLRKRLMVEDFMSGGYTLSLRMIRE